MGCMTNATFSILINGAASKFFHAGQGLRQGCPISPLLIFLIMEGLSYLLEKAKEDGSIHGVRIVDFVQLTCLLFVDDVLIFLDGFPHNNINFLNLLNMFCKATGMDPNNNKSTIMLVRYTVFECGHALALFQFCS